MTTSRWMRSRPPEVALLATVHAIAGAVSLAGAAWPTSAGTPVGLSAGLGLGGLAVSALLWAVGPRVPALTHVALALIAVFVAVQAWQSATAVEVVGLGPALIVVGLYAAHFFSARVARVHTWLAIGLATAGAIAAEPPLVVAWLPAVVAAGMLTEGQARLSARLRAAASTDSLIGVANRQAWEAETARTLALARRTGEPVTVALLDLDGFKQVNDREGHRAGDDLLRAVTAHWSARLRGSDLLGRYGGDEFVVCLTGTDHRGAREVLDRLTDGAPAPWSVGTATAGEGDSLTSLLARADAALYEHKSRRRAA